MIENMKFWEKLDKMLGGDKDPFDVPVGPTKMCITARQLVAFVDDGEKDEGALNEFIQKHLGDCRECLDRLNRYKEVRK